MLSNLAKSIKNGVINTINYLLKNTRNVLVWTFLTALSIGGVTYIDATTNNIICSGESFNRVYRYIGEN